jgi:hypothetical protein
LNAVRARGRPAQARDRIANTHDHAIVAGAARLRARLSGNLLTRINAGIAGLWV